MQFSLPDFDGDCRCERPYDPKTRIVHTQIICHCPRSYIPSGVSMISSSASAAINDKHLSLSAVIKCPFHTPRRNFLVWDHKSESEACDSKTCVSMR